MSGRLANALIRGPRRDLGWEPVHVLFERAAAESPGTPAAVFGDEVVPYAELDRWASRVAEALRAGRSDPRVVGVHMDRRPALLAAIIGTLKAGCPFLLLPPEYPSARLASMVRDAGVRDVLQSGGDVAFSGPAAIDVDALRAAPGEAVPGVRTDLAAWAYVIYTSGTTGDPKGVTCSHLGLANRLLWMRDYYRFGPGKVLLHKSSIGFDISIWELLLPIVSGGTTALAQPNAHMMPRYLRHALVRHRVTFVHFVPTMLRRFLEEPGLDELDALETMIVGGEPWDISLVRAAREKLPRTQLYNGYGPAEASIGVTVWRCDPEHEGTMPLGRAIDNVDLLLLDPDDGEPVAPGEVGELYVGGIQVSPGYVGRPDETRARFVELPLDGDRSERFYRTGDLVRKEDGGDLVFVGRADNQIKLNGVRIELEEIERVASRTPGVDGAGAAVVRRPDRDYLVLFVAPADGELRSRVTREFNASLPATMRPRFVEAVDALPHTPNGKLDRARLALAADAHGELAASKPADGPRLG